MRTATPRLLWVQRCALLVVAITAPWSIVANHSTPVNAVIITIGWATWACSAVASLVVLPLGLTAQRLTMPVLVAISVISVARGVNSASAVIALLAILISAWCAWSPTVVVAMVQGSAFGKETRFPLRTPVPYLAPAFVSWILLTTCVVLGPLLLAARQWAAGAIVSALAIILLSKVPRHIHRLARRWLVIVPAGVVVHDHLVLAETVMVQRNDIRLISALDAPGDEADLTGGVLGQRIRIELGEPSKVVLSQITAKTLGTTDALHVQSFAIAPLSHADALVALGG